MEKNKLILNYCVNFYKIINFDYLEGDIVSEKLLSIYEDFIFNVNINNNEDLENIRYIDKAIAKYIDDYFFRKEMKHELMQIKVKKDEVNILQMIVLNIIKIFERYEEGNTRKIYISRWI